MKIHHKLFHLLELNGPLSDEFESIWKSLTAAHAVTNLVSSRGAYGDAQQHPVAEQLPILVRLFLHLGLILNVELALYMQEADPSAVDIWTAT
jgi:hypothetical protein